MQDLNAHALTLQPSHVVTSPPRKLPRRVRRPSSVRALASVQLSDLTPHPMSLKFASTAPLSYPICNLLRCTTCSTTFLAGAHVPRETDA